MELLAPSYNRAKDELNSARASLDDAKAAYAAACEAYHTYRDQFYAQCDAEKAKRDADRAEKQRKAEDARILARKQADEALALSEKRRAEARELAQKRVAEAQLRNQQRIEYERSVNWDGSQSSDREKEWSPVVHGEIDGKRVTLSYGISNDKDLQVLICDGWVDRATFDRCHDHYGRNNNYGVELSDVRDFRRIEDARVAQNRPNPGAFSGDVDRVLSVIYHGRTPD